MRGSDSHAKTWAFSFLLIKFVEADFFVANEYDIPILDSEG